METEAKRRDSATDILKLIACVGVVVIHVSGQGVLSYAPFTLGWLSCTLWDSLVRFAVPIFFMCTGALMLSPARELPIKKLWSKYFLRVFFIMMFWAWAYYIFTVVGQYVMMGWWEPGGLWNSVVQTLRLNHHLHLYYLQILLLVYAALPLLRALVRGATDKELDYAVGLWLALGIALPLLLKYPPFNWFSGLLNQAAVNMTWSAVGYALLGWVMYSRPVRPERLWRYVAAFAVGLVITLGGTLLATKLSGAVVLDFMEGMSPGPALMSIGIFGAVRILSRDLQASPRLQTLVRASFCVYLIHHFFIMVFRYIGFDVNLFAPIVEIPLETAVVLALSLCGWWVLSKIPFVKDHLI
ncbi:MAG: acyltransferase family protein [Oscillospiraceae bacterium]